MNKPYTEILADIYKEFHKTVREQEEKITEKFDKIIVWLIGFSTGAIVLIASSANKFKSFDKRTTAIVLILLVSSIATGIIARITSAICSYLSYSFAATFEFGLKMVDFPHNPRILNGTETSEEIYFCMDADFKVQMQPLLENKKNASQDQWPQIDESARSVYLEYQKYSSERLKEAKKEIDKILLSSYGLDETKPINPKSIKRKRLLNNSLLTFTYILYIISAISFGIALIYLVIQYVQ